MTRVTPELEPSPNFHTTISPFCFFTKPYIQLNKLRQSTHCLPHQQVNVQPMSRFELQGKSYRDLWSVRALLKILGGARAPPLATPLSGTGF
ncbi:unnamed protein product [Larinioides sclopetarius]|uniref:Uncharacterized protein n=1 Tax=Larinioides sclopetarius TaxID=280406 RepID=A0AAV2B1W3_9ARAC